VDAVAFVCGKAAQRNVELNGGGRRGAADEYLGGDAAGGYARAAAEGTEARLGYSTSIEFDVDLDHRVRGEIIDTANVVRIIHAPHIAWMLEVVDGCGG